MELPSVELAAPKKRCAIYTRKSTHHGLQQEFNSLHLQRSLCSAYVTSQRHKNWTELAKQYDDGGISGATLNRPKLQELLGDIEQGLVDVVVVYKLDRITRTLLDFVRLVDFFERYGVVFVSITQNFDTADSMGRLILNVLLTFAQFEREMASDRVRDKIRGIKQSGRWGGGTPPFGYDLRRHKLYVNENEASHVRHIFARYSELKNLSQVHRECRAAGILGKCCRLRDGRTRGGGPITKSLVNHVLSNPIYIGELRHNDEMFAGLHAPIIDRDTFERVQEIRAEHARVGGRRNKDNVLTDLLFDCFGRRMSVARTFQEGHHRAPSRFYKSQQTAWGKRQRVKQLRARGDDIEELVVAAVSDFLNSRERVRAMLLSIGRHNRELDRIAREAQAAALHLRHTTRLRLRLVLRALIARIELSLERVKIVLRAAELDRYLRWDRVGLFKGDASDWERSRTVLIDIPAGAVRYHRKLVMPIEPRPPADQRKPHSGLRKLVKQARQLQTLVDANRDKSLAELAAESNLKLHRFARVLRLNYLAPDIFASILDGSQPPSLTRAKLVNANLPMDWSLQRALLGFPDRKQPEGGE